MGKAIGTGNIAVGTFSILISILGCATGKLKKPCFAIPYGILTFIVSIVLLIITLSSVALSSKQGQAEVINGLCGGTVSVNGQT